jgi:hypothetical protein
MRRIGLLCCLFALLVIGIGGYTMGQNRYANWNVMSDADVARITGYGCACCYNLCGADDDCPDSRCSSGNGGTCGGDSMTAGKTAYKCGSWGSGTKCDMGESKDTCTVFLCNCDSEKKCKKNSTSSSFTGPNTCNVIS